MLNGQTSINEYVKHMCRNIFINFRKLSQKNTGPKIIIDASKLWPEGQSTTLGDIFLIFWIFERLKSASHGMAPYDMIWYDFIRYDLIHFETTYFCKLFDDLWDMRGYHLWYFWASQTLKQCYIFQTVVWWPLDMNGYYHWYFWAWEIGKFKSFSNTHFRYNICWFLSF